MKPSGPEFRRLFLFIATEGTENIEKNKIIIRKPRTQESDFMVSWLPYKNSLVFFLCDLCVLCG
jgi:hypothetical protein